jgi:hypothetical protein
VLVCVCVLMATCFHVCSYLRVCVCCFLFSFFPISSSRCVCTHAFAFFFLPLSKTFTPSPVCLPQPSSYPLSLSRSFDLSPSLSLFYFFSQPLLTTPSTSAPPTQDVFSTAGTGLQQRLVHTALSAPQRGQLMNTYLKLVDLFTMHCLLPLNQIDEARFYVRHNQVIPADNKAAFFDFIAQPRSAGRAHSPNDEHHTGLAHASSSSSPSSSASSSECWTSSTTSSAAAGGGVRRVVMPSAPSASSVAVPTDRSRSHSTLSSPSVWDAVMGRGGSRRRTLFWRTFIAVSVLAVLWVAIRGRSPHARSSRTAVLLRRLSPLALLAALYQFLFQAPRHL